MKRFKTEGSGANAALSVRRIHSFKNKPKSTKTLQGVYGENTKKQLPCYC